MSNGESGDPITCSKLTHILIAPVSVILNSRRDYKQYNGKEFAIMGKRDYFGTMTFIIALSKFIFDLMR